MQIIILMNPHLLYEYTVDISYESHIAASYTCNIIFSSVVNPLFVCFSTALPHLIINTHIGSTKWLRIVYIIDVVVVNVNVDTARRGHRSKNIFRAKFTFFYIFRRKTLGYIKALHAASLIQWIIFSVFPKWFSPKLHLRRQPKLCQMTINEIYCIESVA